MDSQPRHPHEEMLNIEKIKSEMWFAAHTREIQHTGANKELGTVARSIEDIPVNRMYNNFLHLENDILPKIEASRGRDSADYNFFSGVMNDMLWAVMLASRYEAALKRNGLLQFRLSIQEEIAASMQSELIKYTTMEDLFLSSGLDSIAAGIAKRVSEKLKNKLS